MPLAVKNDDDYVLKKVRSLVTAKTGMKNRCQGKGIQSRDILGINTIIDKTYVRESSLWREGGGGSGMGVKGERGEWETHGGNEGWG